MPRDKAAGNADKGDSAHDRLGRILVRAHDAGMVNARQFIAGIYDDQRAKSLHASLRELSPEERQAVMRLVAYALERTIYKFLRDLENQPLEVQLRVSVDGKWIDPVKLPTTPVGIQELLTGRDGWIGRFSTEVTPDEKCGSAGAGQGESRAKPERPQNRAK